MALTRKFLSALGLEPEKVDEIISAHAETVDALKDKLKDAEGVQAELDSANKKIAELETSIKDGDSYKEKYEQEKADFEKYKNDISTKETETKKRDAYKDLLKEAGISEKHINAVLKVSDTSSIEFGKDGKIKDSDKLLDNIKSDWSDFIVTKDTKGAETPTPPQGNGDATHGSGYARQLADRIHANMFGGNPEGAGDKQ